MSENISKLVEKFFGNTASSYDKVVKFTTFGKDKFWKQKIIDRVKGDSVLDLACGTGVLTRLIAKKLPKSEIVGVDITPGYLEIARKNSSNIANISFIIQDAEKMELGRKFDCITSSYISKYCNAKILITQCLIHLNPGGIIILHDFTCPKNRMIKVIWKSYFVVLRILGIIIPKWQDAFKELPKLICSSDWCNNYISAMKENKMQTQLQTHTLGCSAIIYAKLDS